MAIVRYYCNVPDPDPDPSINKQKIKQNLDFNSFRLLNDMLSLKNDVIVQKSRGAGLQTDSST
jgi:hypothetical protein